MHEQGSYKMFKMFIQDAKVAEKLHIRKLNNNMLNPVQLKMLILHNGFLYWSGHNLAFYEARIKNHDIFRFRIKWTFKKCPRLLFYTFLKLRNERNSRWLMFCGTPCRDASSNSYDDLQLYTKMFRAHKSDVKNFISQLPDITQI